MRTLTSFPVLKDDYEVLMAYLRNAPLELQYDRKHADLLEQHLARASVLGRTEFPRDVVHLGARVVLRDALARLNYHYTLELPGGAGGDGHLSVLSSLGRQLLGARCGDTVTVAAATGRRHYLVSEVSGGAV